MGRICKNSNACRRICRKGGYSFRKDKMLYCSLSKEMIKAEGRCAHWSKKRVVYDLSSQRFDGVIGNIEFLPAYFEGE